MSKDWFTAKEIACLPGVPGTARGISKAAKRENWKSQKRQAQGGGLEYHISSLPAETQSALRARQIDETPLENIALADFVAADEIALKKQQYEQKKTRQDGMAKFTALPSAKKIRARSKEYLILESQKYNEANGYKKIDGLQHFCNDLKTAQIIIPHRFKDHLTHLHGQVHLHPSTLRDWENQYNELGIYALVDNYGSRKGKSKIAQNPELEKIVFQCILDQPHITAKKIKQFIQATAAHLDIVSAKSIERFINNWKAENEQLWTSIVNPDAWKNGFQPAFGSHHQHIDRLNQLWELDSTPADLMLTDGRHSVVGVIDMYGRRMKLLVSKTSTAAAVCGVFRKAIQDWGVPESIRTDNGKDYVSDQFTTVVRQLGIPQELCIPFASEEKGTIERALQTMSHGILDLLPGFIGHNVAERKVIEARKSFAKRIMQPGEVVEVSLSSDELQKKLDQWTDHIYMHDQHSGLDGKTPWEVSTNWTGTINRITDERALDMLLAEVAGIRTITKKGIAYKRHHYIAPELGPIIGNEVQLRLDESDIGTVFVYSLDGLFICKAESPEILGISPVEVANAAKHLTKKVLREQKKELQSIKTSFQKNIAEEIIKHRIEQSQNVTALPHKSQEYTTPALAAAGAAANHKYKRNPPAPKGLNEQEKIIQAELEQTMSQPAQVIDLYDTQEDRYARAYALERREHLNEEDKRWLKAYQNGSEYSAMKEFHEDFGIIPEWSEAK